MSNGAAVSNSAQKNPTAEAMLMTGGSTSQYQDLDRSRQPVANNLQGNNNSSSYVINQNPNQLSS